MDIVVCLVTCPSKEVGAAIARALVNEKLAACVNIVDGVQSVYQWKDEIAVDNEALLIVKTSREKVEQLRSRVLAQHPYELPEFLVLTPSGASEPYTRWILDSVR